VVEQALIADVDGSKLRLLSEPLQQPVVAINLARSLYGRHLVGWR